MATRSQTETQVTWSGADTNVVAADSALDYSDDFTVAGTMIAIEFTVEGNSAGTAINDILQVYMLVKKDVDNSASGVADTYDNADIFELTLDCADGADNQVTANLDQVVAGDIIRFGLKTDGTNAITAGIRITEDKIAL